MAEKKHALAHLDSVCIWGGFAIMPERVIVVGHDIRTGKKAPDGEEHRLYQHKRLNLPVDQDIVASVEAERVKIDVVLLVDGVDALVVEGMQRIKAARVANLNLIAKGLEPKPVPFHLFKGSLEQAALFAFQANAQRQNDDPMTEARTVLRLIDMGHKPETVLAAGRGINEALLRQFEHISAMDMEVQTAVENRLISISAAVQWVKMSREDQRAALAAELAFGGGRVTVMAAKRLRKNVESGEAIPVVPPPPATPLRLVAENNAASDVGDKTPAEPRKAKTPKASAEPARESEATDESDETERNDGLDVHRPPSKREISRLSKYLRDNSSDLTDDFILGIHMATAAGSIPGVIGLCDAMEVFAEQHPKYVKDELTRALAWAAGKRQARTIAGLTKTLAASRKRGKSEPAT